MTTTEKAIVIMLLDALKRARNILNDDYQVAYDFIDDAIAFAEEGKPFQDSRYIGEEKKSNV